MARPRKSSARIVNHGPGKGDQDRTADLATYRKNLDQVKFSGVPAKQDPAFEQQGGKSVKRYGPAPAITIFETAQGRIVIH